MKRPSFVFIHIQKTGGTSIRHALGLRQNDPVKHWTAAEHAAALGEKWPETFSFAFVRNPWDRLVSWWHTIERARGKPGITGFQRYALEGSETFTDFILKCREEIHDSDGVKSVHRDQLSYLTDPAGNDAVSFVGRFENLADDFRNVCLRLGLNAELPHLHVSARRDYRHYYSDVTRQAVAQSYARDIERFGYRF